MANSLDDLLNGSFGKRGSYTSEEIDAALKRQKKKGGTLLDNLAAMTGRSLKKDYDLTGFGSGMPEAGVVHDKKSGSSDQDISQVLADLNQNLIRDFGLDKRGQGLTRDRDQEHDGGQEHDRGQACDQAQGLKPDFAGLEEAVNRRVFGQENYVHKLAIAFKRPFLMPEEKDHARNTIFISGEEETGRHYGLWQMAGELKMRGILSQEHIAVIDLSLYQDQSAGNVLLQDLYAAIQAPGQIIVFENYEACHISCLTHVSALFMTGRCQLKDRYILQKGQMVNVQNSFASETVSYFSAAGKYLVLIGRKGPDQVADILGAPFVNALGDMCQTQALSEEALTAIAREKLLAMQESAGKRLSFNISLEAEEIAKAMVESCPRAEGLKGVLGLLDKLMKALVELKLENDYEDQETLALSMEDSKLFAEIRGDKINLLELLPQAYGGALEAVRAEMDKIVGLAQVKEYIFSLEEYYGVQNRRKEAGLKASEVNKHMIFTGNPGTGKTTIARIVSKYLKAIGVLSGGQLVEVSRGDLVGRYVGHTAPLTSQVIQSAIGGVLFIDEAYSLYRGQEDSFGLEAIDTLVKGIEDNRDNLIVILAGYSREMDTFLSANSGLKSRFPNVIDFPDYSGEELLAIARITAGSKGYTLDQAAEPELLRYFEQVQATNAREAGNGRLVRNKIEEAILNQSKRLAVDKDADLSLLVSGDFVLDL